MALDHTRAEWRCSMNVAGARCVMTAGTGRMGLSCAVCWASMALRRCTGQLALGKVRYTLDDGE
ncbi:hypothetical protein LEMLEM_LOCUS6263 [Lemmus lemmus]